ncbi:jg9915 [Pararge aegeria aegeria]|uniref:Jg9915 protein n=1 Tax=Pararge aegeria aegeria TaxID=348720 RepID=A0A8S4RBT7_9NEOP|nr:jg9915 [Pararge aegeria aegeria]
MRRIYFINSPQASTAEHRPFQECTHGLPPFSSSRFQPPFQGHMSSRLEVVSHSAYRFAVTTPERVCHNGHRSYDRHDHCHLNFLILSAMSVSLHGHVIVRMYGLCTVSVIVRISSLRILSRRETPNIARSIARYATLNL